MIISRIVGISEDCDQNGERVSKTDKSCHVCIMRLKGVLVKYEKMGLCLLMALPYYLYFSNKLEFFYTSKEFRFLFQNCNYWEPCKR